MKRTYLEFEKPVETLEAKIESLKKAHDDHPTIDVNKELNSLQEKLEAMQHQIFDNLTAWQISQVSRHPQRPYTQDYIDAIFMVSNAPSIEHAAHRGARLRLTAPLGATSATLLRASAECS